MADGSGKKLVLKNKEGVVLAHMEGLLTEELAQKHIKNTIAQIKQANDQLESWIEAEAQTKAGALFSDDPYSHKISIVLPAWIARFQNEKLRTLLEHTVRYHAPAHVSLLFHWVGLKQMQEFEQSYQAWKEMKRQALSDHIPLDQLSYRLIVLLKHFQDPEDQFIQEELDDLRKMND